MTQMLRNFTHITIPAEIWLRKDLSMQAKCLWAEIRSLHNKEAGGCFASDEYLCEFLQLQNRRFYYILKELKDAGLLESKSNGRQAIRVAIVPEVEYQTGQQLSGDKSSAKQKCRKVQSRSAEKCSAQVQDPAVLSNIYNKEDNKVGERGDKSPNPPPKISSSLKKSKEEKVKFKDNVFLTQSEYDNLCAKYSKAVIDSYIEKIWSYQHAHGKKYVSHSHAIDSWIKKDADKTERKIITGKLALPGDGVIDPEFEARNAAKIKAIMEEEI